MVKAAVSPWDGRRNECAPTKVGDACLGAYWLCGLTVKIVRGAFARPEPPLPPVLLIRVVQPLGTPRVD